MKNKTLLSIIKQKGVGRYLGICEGNLDAIENYSEYIQMSVSDEKKYHVEFLVNRAFSECPEKQLYEGFSKYEADRIFNKAVENEKKTEINLENKTLCEN